MNLFCLPLQGAVGFDIFGLPLTEGDNIPSSLSSNYGNLACLPMPGTLSEVSWTSPGDSNSVREGQVLCEQYWYDTNLPQTACPRYIARNQLQRLASLGYELYSGFEMEFILADSSTKKPVFAKDKVHFLDNTIFNAFKDVIYGIDDALKKLGVQVETYQVEYAPGQFEAAMAPAKGIEAADSAFHFRQVWKEVLPMLRPGMVPLFMAKPYSETNGNGMHYSHSLLHLGHGENAMYDPESSDNLSDTARHWIAGLLKHMNATIALTSPTVNCYRRLHSPWSPHIADWAIEDRTAALRVKNVDASSTYVECRVPSGSANTYLVQAAIVAAGIDGLVNKLQSPPSGKHQTSQLLPETLQQALDELEADAVMAEALGQEFVRWFVIIKKREITYFGEQVGKCLESEEKLDREWEKYSRI